MPFERTCHLLPFKRRDVISLQSVKEMPGWWITNFHIPSIWADTTGEGITVAVIDSGVDLTHEDLKDNLVEGYNFVNPKKPPEDYVELGHGTHVAGIIAAEHNSIGIVGVAPNAKIMPIKVLDKNGDTTIARVVKAIRWAVKQRADIISMSLGISSPVPSLRRAIREAYEQNIPVFAAAGNLGDKHNLMYPANYPETISVAAVTRNLKVADFNNLADNLDLLAPGVDILSTVPKNVYAIMSGSSMAQPFVCGIAALILSYMKSKSSIVKIEDLRKLLKQGVTHAHCKTMLNCGIVSPIKILKEMEKD